LVDSTNIINSSEIFDIGYVFNGLKLVVIFLFAFCVFYYILHQISNLVSFFGAYHEVDNSKIVDSNKRILLKELVFMWITGIVCSVIDTLTDSDKHPKNSEKEAFEVKISLVTKHYVALSLTLIFSFYIIIINPIVPLHADQHATALSITLALCTLLSIRLLANPNDYPKLNILFPQNKTDLLEQHRERVLSFLYGFICTNLFVAFSIIGYSLYSQLNFPLPTLNLEFHVIMLIIYYVLLLSIVVLIGELFLLYRVPIHYVYEKSEPILYENMFYSRSFNLDIINLEEEK
jgi:hypothetical protein